MALVPVAKLVSDRHRNSYFLFRFLLASFSRGQLRIRQIRGNLLLGWLVDRCGFGPVLSVTFAVAAFAVVTIGQVASSLAFVFIAIGIAGFCVLGAQSGLNALGPSYYPVSVRSTGTGWASGIGRFGSVVGPVVGSQLISLQWSTAQLFQAAAGPCCCRSSRHVDLLASYPFGNIAHCSDQS
jgi:AAHS family 4-hydroxybenzoate transporter-like MFS transporter